MLTNSFWNKRNFTHLLNDTRIFIIAKIIQMPYGRNLEIFMLFFPVNFRKRYRWWKHFLMVDLYFSENLKFIFQDHTSFIPALYFLPLYLQLKDENGFSLIILRLEWPIVSLKDAAMFSRLLSKARDCIQTFGEAFRNHKN